MKKIIFILFVIITTTFFANQFEIRLPAYDKENGVYQIYTFEYPDKLEVTVVFWDEDHPSLFIDFIYDIYRFFKWGRFYDIETFFILDDRVIFEDDYCNSQSYFQTENLHNYKELSTDVFENDGEKLVIYVSTWNHMFSNKPLPNTNYITYFPTNLVGTRRDVEQFFSWHKNKKLITTFVLTLIVFLFFVLTVFFKKKSKSKVIFKVLTTFTIFLISLLNSSGVEFLIVAGLFFGMLGDFLLEFEDKFLHGMVSFLIGHIFYLLSFLMKFGLPNILVFFIILSILLILYFVILFKKSKNFKIPILIYTIAIGIMFSFTFSPAFKDIYYLRFMLPLAGGLFVFSDFLIAIEKFVRKIKYSEIIILGTYFLAQLIIALSTIF
ncbi:putative membrane protein YhhN [Thermosipho japonicus]|uniref:Putative membrane protein YhhN n=1 Tax=Thermosipho japonicus TaxID=90323 RepID=A0A841GT62_9BACT|nr:lysoplasmalogenase [Thermosipho japonicus]MBB6063069.1 putative membrane protein YhhN [Thermosipho japonicus]